MYDKHIKICLVTVFGKSEEEINEKVKKSKKRMMYISANHVKIFKRTHFEKRVKRE